MSKPNGQAAKMSFSGHGLMKNRNGQRLRRLVRVVLALLALEVHPRLLVAAAYAVAVAAMRIVVVLPDFVATDEPARFRHCAQLAATHATAAQLPMIVSDFQLERPLRCLIGDDDVP
jgi:hypothetical protein